MSDCQQTPRVPRMELLPFQTEFVRRVLAPDSSRIHVLNGPPGTGMTAAAIGAIAEGVERGQLRRVLFVGPRVLAHQALIRVSEATDAGPCRLIDKNAIVEMEAATTGAGNVWPDVGVFAVSIDFAKQKRFSEYFSGCQWDLVVFDEVHHVTRGSERGAFLTQVLDGPAKCIVLIDRFPDSRVSDLLTAVESDQITVTKWTASQLLTQGGAVFDRTRIEWNTIPFQMNEHEVDFYSHLDRTARDVDAMSGANGALHEYLMSCAMSCLFAVERSLMDQRTQLLKLREESARGALHAVRQQSLFDDIAEDERQLTLFDEMKADAASGAKYTTMLRMVEDALSDLDELETDSKSDALIALLTSMPDRQICILSQYQSTVSHLESRLRHATADPIAMYSDGTQAAAFTEQVLTMQPQRRGIVLATDAVLLGVELSADIVIHYDLPLSSEHLYFRVARFSRLGKSGVIQMYGLVEQNAITTAMWVKRLAMLYSSARDPDRVVDLCSEPGAAPG